MKKIILLILIILKFTALSQFPVEIGLVVKNDKNQPIQNLFFGVHPNATDQVDKSLNELSYPPFPPMGNVFQCVFEYIDSTQYNKDSTKYYDLIWTNRDLRSVKEPKFFFEQHYLRMYWGNGTKLSFNWSSIPKDIDSIFITDPLGGFIIKIDMKKQSSYELTNIGIKSLLINVYYNKNYVAVTDENTSINISPQPFDDVINISNLPINSHIQLFNLNGELVFDKKINQSDVSIETNSLLNCYYYLVVSDNNKIITTRKLIKINK